MDSAKPLPFLSWCLPWYRKKGKVTGISQDLLLIFTSTVSSSHSNTAFQFHSLHQAILLSELFPWVTSNFSSLPHTLCIALLWHLGCIKLPLLCATINSMVSCLLALLCIIIVTTHSWFVFCLFVFPPTLVEGERWLHFVLCHIYSRDTVPGTYQTPIK